MSTEHRADFGWLYRRDYNFAECEADKMKYGMRKPSLKKSFSARTKGRATRTVKKALIPGVRGKLILQLRGEGEENSAIKYIISIIHHYQRGIS